MLKTTQRESRQTHGRGVHRAAPRDRRWSTASRSTRDIKEEKVISDATIQGVFGNRFQTTGLTMNEARETALLLRGGALAAPISIANERVIGPQLGAGEHREGRARRWSSAWPRCSCS